MQTDNFVQFPLNFRPLKTQRKKKVKIENSHTLYFKVQNKLQNSLNYFSKEPNIKVSKYLHYKNV